jgi:hypothetical protein
MKTFKELRRELEEHPNLRARIIAKINPMDALRDKMDDLKKLPGKIKDKAIDKLKDTMDKVNPLSAVNIGDTKSIEKKIGKLRDKKRDNTTQNKKLGVKIKTLQRQKKGSKKT